MALMPFLSRHRIQTVGENMKNAAATVENQAASALYFRLKLIANYAY
jgi:hypothetical protein